MKKVIDISKFMSADNPELVLFGKTYVVKNDKKTVLLLTEMQRKAATKPDENIDNKILQLLIKEDADELIETLEGMANYAANERTVMINVLALATGEDVEVLEKRFQRAQERG